MVIIGVVSGLYVTTHNDAFIVTWGVRQHRYNVTDTGLRMAMFLTRVHDRLLPTGLAHLSDPTDPAPLRAAFTHYQHHRSVAKCPTTLGNVHLRSRPGFVLGQGRVGCVYAGDDDEYVNDFERALKACREGDCAEYFEVLRRSVSDVPLQMRFGRCLWLPLETGRRHLVWLVSHAYDEANPTAIRGSQANEPWRSRITEDVIQLRAQVDQLLELLAASSALTTEQVEQIRSQEGEGYGGHRRHERVRDADVDMED